MRSRSGGRIAVIAGAAGAAIGMTGCGVLYPLDDVSVYEAPDAALAGAADGDGSASDGGGGGRDAVTVTDAPALGETDVADGTGQSDGGGLDSSESPDGQHADANSDVADDVTSESAADGGSDAAPDVVEPDVAADVTAPGDAAGDTAMCEAGPNLCATYPCGTYTDGCGVTHQCGHAGSSYDWSLTSACKAYASPQLAYGYQCDDPTLLAPPPMAGCQEVTAYSPDLFWCCPN